MFTELRKNYEKNLRRIAFFSGFPPSVREEVERRCVWKIFEPKQTIIEYHDRTTEAFFLIAGRARVVIYSKTGKAVAFRDLEPGTLFGEFAAIDSAPRSARVEASERCFLAAMSSQDFWELMLEEPVFLKAVLRHLVKLNRALTERVFEFSTLVVSNRVQAELLRLARGYEQNGNTAVISHAPTHEEIANRISTHRQAVTAELNRLSHIGVIGQHGRKIVVFDVNRLNAMVKDATGE